MLLTDDEKSMLIKLYKTSLNQTVRKRSHCLLLSNDGKQIKELSSILKMDRQTIVRLFNKWDSKIEDKVSILSIASGRGPKTRLEQVKDIIPDLVAKHSRKLDLILLELRTVYNIVICKETLQIFLKDAGL